MENKTKQALIVIAAGGTGGHIFPALAVCLQIKSQRPDVGLLWIGTTRSREVDLCKRHGIALTIVDVSGIERKFTMKAAKAAVKFVIEFFRLRSMFAKNRPAAIVAFGGYVCAPVLAAARMSAIPYFIHEQNTVAGLVNRLFAAKAQRVFAGFPLIGRQTLGLKVFLTGTPVRTKPETFPETAYPKGFNASATTILICGGSQGAQTMNSCCVDAVRVWAGNGYQVVWQTGTAGHEEIRSHVGSFSSVFLFSTIEDLYPFYACARVVVGRAGASTLAEIAFFGLPCVLIPLPWATENHQWTNAGVVESQGWGIRVKQDASAAGAIETAVAAILSDNEKAETMKRKALTHAPTAAAATIAQTVLDGIIP